MERFFLKDVIDVNLKKELECKILFVSTYIKQFEVIVEKNRIIAVDLIYDRTKITKEMLATLLDLMLQKEFYGKVKLEEKVLWDNNVEKIYYDNVYDKLVDLGEIIPITEGIIAMGDMMHQLCNFFDREIVKIAQETFDVKLMYYPALIKYETLDKIDYVNELPQFLMFVTSIQGTIKEYYDYKKVGFDYNTDIKKTEGLRLCLPPSVCYHIYEQYNHKNLNGKNLVLSAVGRTFRNEGNYAKELERLLDFTMREVVFLGDKEFVEKSNVRIFLGKIIEFLQKLELSGRIVSADDLFYKGEEEIDIRVLQKIKKSKYEIRLKLNKNDELAVGSFNLHGKFFGEKFEIKYDQDNFACTSCTGYGLERFAYAFLCQYGVDLNKWPLYVLENIY